MKPPRESAPTPEPKSEEARDTRAADPESQVQASISGLMWRVKRPRYAHMGKHHELQEEFAEADMNYMMLAEAQQQTLGASHPDVATALYELGNLNHLHKIEHRPDIEIIYNTMGRANQVSMFYSSALGIREEALGERHPALAQSLYGFARLHKDSGMFGEALSLLERAQNIYDGEEDPLPSARCALCTAEIHRDRKSFEASASACHTAERFLTSCGLAIIELERAEQSCEQINARPDDFNHAQECLKEARAIQTRFADPFHGMAFDLLQGSVDLMPMMLDLHRQQYRRDLIAALNTLAAIHRETGNVNAAIPVYEQIAELQRKDALC